MPSSLSADSAAYDSPRLCKQCGGTVVVAGARYCKECGASLRAGLHIKRELTWNPWLAGGLSIIPGAGHLYKRQPMRAAGWFIAVVATLGMWPLGVMLWAICAVNAALEGAVENTRPQAPPPEGDARGALGAAGAVPRA